MDIWNLLSAESGRLKSTEAVSVRDGILERHSVDGQEVKGAAWGAIAACVHSAEAAGAAWERLVQEAVLVQAGSGAVAGGATPILQYDMTYQLNETEVRGRALRWSDGRLHATNGRLLRSYAVRCWQVVMIDFIKYCKHCVLQTVLLINFSSASTTQT